MKIISFGITKDITGASLQDLDFGEQPISIADLKTLLMQKFPALSTVSTISFAVNNAYATAETMVTYRDEVALIPPVSGG